jgi:hypothetical protein
MGVLRAVLAHAARATDEAQARAILTQWLTHLADTKNRADRWRVKGGVDRLRLLDRLRGLFGDDEQIWAQLELSRERRAMLSLSPHSVDVLSGALWIEAVQATVVQAIRASRG